MTKKHKVTPSYKGSQKGLVEILFSFFKSINLIQKSTSDKCTTINSKLYVVNNIIKKNNINFEKDNKGYVYGYIIK